MIFTLPLKHNYATNSLSFYMKSENYSQIYFIMRQNVTQAIYLPCILTINTNPSFVKRKECIGQTPLRVDVL